MLKLYVVYNQPFDFPQSWVVREWRVNADGVQVARHCACAGTLEEARAILPRGLVRTERWEQDDPAIHEVWL